MPLELHFLGRQLLQPAINDLCTAGGSPTGAVARALQAHLFDCVRAALGSRLYKPPVVRPEIAPGEGDPATLPILARDGYETYYIEVRFATCPGDVIEDLQLRADDIELIPIDYGWGIQRVFQLKVTTLKRQTNHVLRINHLRIPGYLFQEILAEVSAPGKIEQSLLPNFQPGPDIEGFRVVSYDHMLTGARLFCSCSKKVHRYMLEQAYERLPQYVPGSWPEKVVALLEQAVYAEGICHLCLARRHSPEEVTRFYGAGVETNFEKFLDQVIFDSAMDRKTARAEIMQVLGLSRWVREAQLFKVVRELFPDHRVIREASPDWLGRMRLDIFLPELNLAIEHQGEQHYRPIALFGGDDGYARVVERDALKRRLCQENGVELIDVRFDAAISRAVIRQRLQRYLTQKD